MIYFLCVSLQNWGICVHSIGLGALAYFIFEFRVSGAGVRIQEHGPCGLFSRFPVFFKGFIMIQTVEVSHWFN